jgi:CII-binding regulator of phage lambda lysogenization HflD
MNTNVVGPDFDLDNFELFGKNLESLSKKDNNSLKRKNSSMKYYDNNDDSFYVQMDELDKKLVKDNAKLKLEEITTNKINEINEMNKKMENITKTSNSDLPNIYNNIIKENNEKIKQITDIYNNETYTDAQKKLLYKTYY